MAAHFEVALGGMLQGSSAMAAWPASINKKQQTSGAFWEEEVVQLMMGRALHNPDAVHRPCSDISSSSPWRPNGARATLDLLGASSSASPPPFAPDDADDSASHGCFDLDADAPLPSGWEKCLDLQTGSIYYFNRSTGLTTSCNPGKTPISSANWPASPSSSSDVTVEANVPGGAVSTNKLHGATSCLEAPVCNESTNLDLTLSLKPSSPCLRPQYSVNLDLNGDVDHKFRSLIASQNKQTSAEAPLKKPSFFSSVSSLPLKSTRISYALPSGAASVASPTSCSSPSALFLSGHEDKRSLATSKMSCEESKSINSKQISPFSRGTLSSSPLLSRNCNVSANAKPITNTTHPDVSRPMMTVGCANCLMFVMLPTSRSPQCPRCGAFVDTDLLPQPPSSKKPKLSLSLMS